MLVQRVVALKRDRYRLEQRLLAVEQGWRQQDGADEQLPGRGGIAATGDQQPTASERVAHGLAAARPATAEPGGQEGTSVAGAAAVARRARPASALSAWRGPHPHRGDVAGDDVAAVGVGCPVVVSGAEQRLPRLVADEQRQLRILRLEHGRASAELTQLKHRLVERFHAAAQTRRRCEQHLVDVVDARMGPVAAVGVEAERRRLRRPQWEDELIASSAQEEVLGGILRCCCPELFRHVSGDGLGRADNGTLVIEHAGTSVQTRSAKAPEPAALSAAPSLPLRGQGRRGQPTPVGHLLASRRPCSAGGTVGRSAVPCSRNTDDCGRLVGQRPRPQSACPGVPTGASRQRAPGGSPWVIDVGAVAAEFLRGEREQA